ncbi:MAG: hypothetical protein NW226_22760 [Microscillaceae bacterium]|nr:hypothetical protein [Microscillaceae bacterium]
MSGAGGTDGGTSRFFTGLIMLVAGLYMFLSSVHVNFNLGSRIYAYGSFNVTSGMILIPFMLGVGMLFFNAKNVFGWVLSVGSLVILIFGVISNTELVLQRMDAFSLIVILVLMVGGLGLFLSSFRSSS